MVNERECLAAGLDPKKVESIGRRLERICREAERLGIQIFMGSSCSLRARDRHARPLILRGLAITNGDGGDGGTYPDDEGLERGE